MVTIQLRGSFILVAVATLVVRSVYAEGLDSGRGIKVTNRAPQRPTVFDHVHPEAHQPGSTDQGELGLPDELYLNQTIRDIYARFALASKASGHDIEIHIRGIDTYYPEQFEQVQWLHLFTEPGGATLETITYVSHGRLPSLNRATYVSRWTDVDGRAWFQQDFLKEGNLTVENVIDLSAELFPTRTAGTNAVSSFEVEIAFEATRRLYRAAVLWKYQPPDRLLFTLVDQVAPGVDRTFHEEGRVVSLAELQDNRPPLGKGPVSKASCVPGSESFPGVPLRVSSDTGHASEGFHFAGMQAHFQCTTRGDCDQTCAPSLPISACGDRDSPFPFVHRVFTKISLSSLSGANLNAAECGAAFGCAVKSCFLGICGGVSFGVAGRGASLTIAPTSPVLSDLSLSDGKECPIEEGPTQCSALTAGVVAMSLDNVDSALDLTVKHAIERGAGDLRLRRVEEGHVLHHGAPIQYLMGEWALVSVPAGEETTPRPPMSLRASSKAFAEAQVAELSTLRSSGAFAGGGKASQDRIVLIVAKPPHPRNDRYIPMPALKLALLEVPFGTAHRNILVRADFAENHELESLEILHDTAGGVTQELALMIEKGLSLERVIDKDHRVIAFALISVTESLSLARTISYLPKCCDGCEFEPDIECY